MSNLKIVTNNDEPVLSMLNGRVLTSEESAILTKMNSNFSHVIIGGKHRIMTKKMCPINGYKLAFETISDFSNNFEHLPSLAGTNRGKAWFKWNDKIFYPDGMGFYPDLKLAPELCYNTFEGFKCKAIKGDVDLIVTHIKAILCAGEEEAGEYFIQWLAHIFQFPAVKPSVAILIKSVEGTGKGTLYKLLQKMLGVHSAQINGHYQMTGRFNAVIAGKLLIFGDEVDLTTKAVFDKAKGIISETSVSMEYKGIDPEPMPNLARFIFTGNHDKIISAGTRERRFLVLEPSATHVENTSYWNQLHNLIETVGPARFLHHLLNLDLSDFNPYKAPATKGLIDEKLTSLRPSLSYLLCELQKEQPFDRKKQITANELIFSFMEWSQLYADEKIKLASARSQIGKAMTSMGIHVIGRSGRGDGKYYVIPEKSIMRCSFAKILGHKEEDIF
jgi:putative DNA primase/helicase